MTIIEEEGFARKFMMHFEGIYSVLFDRTRVSDHCIDTIVDKRTFFCRGS